MRLTSAWLGWRSVRRRPGTFLGAILVLIISAVMVSGFSLVYFSAGSQEETVERYSGVPVVVVPEGIESRIPFDLVGEIEALDEVSEVVPEVTFSAALLDPDGEVINDPNTARGFGHAWPSSRLTPLRMLEGEPPTARNEIVVDRGLAEAGDLMVGRTVDVLVLGEISSFTISGVVGPEDESLPSYQTSIFFSEDHVEEMADYASGHIDAIGVRPLDGVGESTLAAAVRTLTLDRKGQKYEVLTGDERGPAEGNLSAAEDELFALSTLTLLQLAVVCTIGVVASAIGLSVRGRHKEIAMLRAIGATPWQVRRMITGEAALLSMIALAIGVPLGAVLMGLRPELSGLLLRNNMSPAFQVHFTASGVLLSVTVVLLSALVAGLIASRSALRIRPSEAIAEATTEGRELNRGRILLGCAAVVGTLAGAVALAVLDLPVDTVGLSVSVLLVVLAVAASGLLAPWVVSRSTSLLRRVVIRFSRNGPPLSVANVVFYHRRFAGVAGPLLLGITLVGASSASQMYFNWSYGVQQSVRFTSDFVVSSSFGFGEEARARIDEIAVVASTATARRTPVEPLVAEPLPHGESAMILRGDVAGTLDLDLVEGRILAEDGGSIIVADSFAERNGLGVGDGLNLTLPGNDREYGLTVSGIYGDKGFLDTPMAFGPATADALDLKHGAPDGVFVNTVPEVETEAARTQIEDLFPGEAESTVFVVHDRESMRRVNTEAWAENNRGGTSAIFLMGMFMLFAAVNAISMTQFDRKREFAGGRMLGITWRSTYGMVFAEVIMTITLVFSIAALATLWIASLITLPTGTAMLTVIPEVIPVVPVTALGVTALILSLLGALAAVRGVRRSGD
ncbi:FtsX-like permease family protein [Nocardiopsis alba]|uniref:FtsX-like permease family protein n=1 Tax=Nocardiopsis alba TaxID=53437 RepID=A0A7K2IT11_9ACTN|nr:FtsX-like permease family protein [Nocardiopsis alba]MYR32954.1 FtsX-like permease family protein [Nocardiopsis alba]